LRFPIDAQLPPSLARWLRARGYPSDHVHEIGPGAASDDEIEAEPGRPGVVIWSKDADFAARAKRAQGPQVVWLRLGNTTNASLRARPSPQLSSIEAALAGGEFLIEVR